MGIHNIKIRNYKSLKSINLNMEKDKYNIHCILGKNGAGKSTFINALNYFYENLNNNSRYKDFIVDKMNPYTECMEIEIIYNLGIISTRNINEYLSEILLELEPYIKNNKILIKMTQYKDGVIEWFPKNKNIRKYISKIFPLYSIDTRFISLKDWSKIWDVVSDLSVTNIKIDNQEANSKLDDVFKTIYGDKYSKVLDRVSRTFDNEKITVNNLDYYNRFKHTLFTRLGGDEFISDEKNLDYYSDGVNSLKYIKLTLDLIALLSETGWKKPLIILDEPEIGLHPQFIDELIECITNNALKGLNIFISTHSTKVITGLIKNNTNSAIYRINKYNNYSYIEKMKDIINQDEKFLISNKETECYFSNAIICVEGKTETQVLSNPKIISLFNEIKKVTFYQYNSDNRSMKLIYPDNMNFTIPHLVIVDMDKIFKYNHKKKIFKLNNDGLVNPLYSEKIFKKQKFMYFGKQKFRTYNVSRYIKKTIKKCKFEHHSKLYYINDILFNHIIKLTKLYCLQYNIYPVTTTIEGCIVNIDNLDIVLSWIKTVYDENNILKLNNILEKDKLIEGKKNNKYRLIIIRLILNGKLDNLNTLKEAKDNHLIDKQDLQIIEELRKFIGGKTDGWVISFINYYFENYIDKLSNEYDKEQKFKEDFKELYDILQKITNMVL